MTKAKKNSIKIQYLYVLMIISLSFQISNELPILSWHYLFWSVGIAFGIYYSHKYFFNPATLAALLYLGFVLLDFFSGDQYFKSFVNCFTETVNIFIPATLLYYLYSVNDKRLFYWIFIFYFIFLVESSIVSLYANITYPGIIRLQASNDMMVANDSILRPFRIMGMTSYALPHALPIIMPALICVVKNSIGKVKSLFALLTVFVFLLIYASGSATALLLSIIILFFSLFFNVSTSKNVIRSFVFFILLLLPLLLNKELEISIIESFRSFFSKGSLLADKLVDIENSIRYENAEGAVGGRNNLYQLTFDEFFKYPIFGTNGEVGGHCALIDRLATLGTVGFIPFLFFLYYQFEFTVKHISVEKRGYYYMGFITSIIMMSVKGFAGWDMWFCLLVMLPGILWWSKNLDKR